VTKAVAHDISKQKTTISQWQQEGMSAWPSTASNDSSST